MLIISMEIAIVEVMCLEQAVRPLSENMTVTVTIVMLLGYFQDSGKMGCDNEPNQSMISHTSPVGEVAKRVCHKLRRCIFITNVSVVDPHHWRLSI